MFFGNSLMQSDKLEIIFITIDVSPNGKFYRMFRHPPDGLPIGQRVHGDIIALPFQVQVGIPKPP